MKNLKRVIPWLTASLIMILAVLLILSCVQIYQSGSRPFTPEIISEYAGRLSILGILCLIFVVVGLFLPAQANSTKTVQDQKAQIMRYTPDLPEAQKQRKLRKIYRIILSVIVVFLSIYPVFYLLDGGHFTVANVNADVQNAAIVVLIPTAVCMVLFLIYRHLESVSIGRELDAYRTKGIKPGKAPTKQNTDGRPIRAIRCVLLITGIVLVIVGAFNGGAADVLGKAIRICTECIGLG